MSRLDDLPPDQRAVLLLLVRQGKSQSEIADMLGIPQRTVRDRAREALDALAQEPSEPAAAARTPARDSGGRTRASGDIRSSTPLPTSSPAPASSPAHPTSQTPGAGFSGSLPSSRRGGAILLAALVVIVVVAVILITDGGSSHKNSSAQTGSTPSATTSTPSTSTTSGAAAHSGKPTLDKQIALTSPSEPNSKTVGLVEVLSEGSKRAFYIAAEHLPPSTGFFYAVWLYNSPTNTAPLGRIPPVGSNGQAQGGALLPANAGDYHEILLTRETNSRATQPGQVVLSGAFSLGGH
jgi:Sigma-70, region 4